MLNEIKEKLLEIDPVVDYGLGKFSERDAWDCIIFRRKKMQKTGQSKSDYTEYYKVVIVREEEIPEGLEQEVIEKMRELNIKQTETPSEYEYVLKSNELVVECCFLEFYKTKKRVC